MDPHFSMPSFQPGCGIYLIENTVTHTVYVGKTATSFEGRWNKHRKTLWGHTHFNRHLQNAWLKYGAKAFEFVVLEDVQDEQQLAEIENWYLAYFRSIGVQMYNHKIAGPAGIQHHSDETRAKISAAFRGKPLSESHRANIAKARTGRKHSETTKAKIGQIGRGRTPSPETLIRMREVQLGKIIPTEQRVAISQKLQGHSVSDETREKLRIARSKQTISDETRKRMREAQQRRRQQWRDQGL
jgi:group I intron endonuclease